MYSLYHIFDSLYFYPCNKSYFQCLSILNSATQKEFEHQIENEDEQDIDDHGINDSHNNHNKRKNSDKEEADDDEDDDEIDDHYDQNTNDLLLDLALSDDDDVEIPDIEETISTQSKSNKKKKEFIIPQYDGGDGNPPTSNSYPTSNNKLSL